MEQQAIGRFWAVGVGPGDPELLTVKAMNVLRRVPVLYHPGPRPDQGRAWEVVRSLVRPEQQVRVLLAEPMREAAAGGTAHYLPAVEQIAAECRRGRDVACLTEGDPTLYSTAAHVWELLTARHPDILIEVVPGVSALTAAAAHVGWSLAQKEEMLAVVPALHRAAELGGVLDSFASVCFLKASGAVQDIQRALQEHDGHREAVYVENVGTGRVWTTRDLDRAATRNEYFSLVLVRRSGTPVAEDAVGKVWVVGLGPGDHDLLTPEAQRVLRQAEVVIGYEAYLQSLTTLGIRARTLISSPIGAEAERATQALHFARAGRRVALVSSGDAGVYGMASLLLELAELLPDLDVELVPGVTAATAAAALLGAPLGHDFACVSLSDLLTPWEVIEGRLRAAGQGDFVLAVYNPLSRRRTWQLPRAREILLGFRSATTPVGLVDRAFRPGTRVWQTTLGELTSEGIGMETLLILGNSQTRLINGRMVTPRGYRSEP